MNPVYLFFTTWVQMRHVVRDRRLDPKADAFLASQDHTRWIGMTDRRIVFVRSHYQAEGRDFERWYDNSHAARRQNEINRFETEIINV